MLNADHAGVARCRGAGAFPRHRAAGNAFLENTLHRLWDRIAVSTVSNLSDDAWAATVTEQHAAICRAINDGDDAAAREQAEGHITAALRTYQQAH